MTQQDDAAHLTTEARNPASVHLDQLNTREFVLLMNREDGLVIPAVAREAEAIARAIDASTEKMRTGGRLVYIGAGTSGRLGVLDAAECPPTFRTPPEMVIGLIAGGTPALTKAVEGAEDNPEQAVADLLQIKFNKYDVLVGIASSGRTPYVLGAVDYARTLGALTIGVTCNAKAQLNDRVDIAIAPVVGPEILSGSTRLKAGTATKLVLNMLSTGVMVKLGKTYGNLMVDLRATNTKLIARARRILQTITGITLEEASHLLNRCQGEVKTALVCQLGQKDPEVARELIHQSQGRVEHALQLAGYQSPRPATNTKLILGIDGGGTGTTALLAEQTTESYKIIGRGEAGPSNRQSVGDATAVHGLSEAVAAAFRDARLEQVTVGAACLGLAGADRPADRLFLENWAQRIHLAERVQITNDADLLLAAGTPHGLGLAIIAGTGSIAYGKNHLELRARAGGWGPLLGDAGSAYAIAVEALQTAAVEIDLDTNLHSEPITLQNALWPLIQKHWNLKDPRDLIEKVYRSGLDRAQIATLAPLILQAYADNNVDAQEIIEHQATSLAGDASIVMRKLFQDEEYVPVVMAGGLFEHHPAYVELVLQELRRCQTSETRKHPLGQVTVVKEPAEGAVRLAWLEQCKNYVK